MAHCSAWQHKAVGIEKKTSTKYQSFVLHFCLLASPSHFHHLCNVGDENSMAIHPHPCKDVSKTFEY